MAVKFIPVRGTEEKIQASEYQDGYIYFATDSGKIYVDSQGERTTMGAAGAAVYFGSQDKVHENEDTGYFEIPKVTISGSPKPGDLILNSDGGFYKVVSVGTEICVCTLLTVSGGGGNVLGGLRPSITLNVENTNLLNGQTAYFHIQATSAMGPDGVTPIDTDLSVVYSLGDRISDTVVNNYITQTRTYKTGEKDYEGVPGVIDDYIEIGSLLKESHTTVLTVYVQGPNHDEKSYSRQIDISTSALTLSHSTGYDPATKYPVSGFDIKCNVVGALSKIIEIYYDDLNTPLSSRVISASQADTVESFNIGTDLATHGHHTVRIELWQNIGTDQKPKKGLPAAPLQYEIAVIDSTNPNAKPVIWLGEYQKEYYNYDTIQIPFLAWDPSNTSKAVVHLYRNKIELESSPREITDFTQFTPWEIADAEMDGINTYQLSCGETNERKVEREISFKVVKDPNRDMTVEKAGLLLDFSTLGRSNAESAAKRKIWKYSLRGVEKQAVFEDFNWYNNGWIIDNKKNTPNCKDTTNTSCLRISNGAKFRIPFEPIVFASGVSGKESHTVEVQFRVRNVQNYDNLISNITRYQGDGQWYTDFKNQIATGYDNYDAYLQATLRPEQYEDLKFSHVEKNIHINNVVGGIYDYNKTTNKVTGFCIGTQDAFFSNGENTVNVDFVENELVNLSFVYQHSLKLLYIYINGVITGVIRSSDSDSFSIESTDFVFDSSKCDIDLFKLRIYNSDLNVNQIVKNFSVDRKNVKIFDQSGMYALASENQALKEFQFSYEAMLKYNEAHPKEPLMPYIIYDTGAASLPYSKDDTKYISVEFVNTPLESAYNNGQLERLAKLDGLIAEDETDEEKIKEGIRTYYRHHCPSWTSTMRSSDRIEFAVQGTSSEFYPRRNYKIKTKMEMENCWKDNSELDEEDRNLEAGGAYTEEEALNIFMNRGPYAEIYVKDKSELAKDSKYLGYEKSRMSDGWYMNNYTNPTDRWTMKVDYMESSGSYNAGFASLVGNGYTKHPLQDYYNAGLLTNTDKLKPVVDSSEFSDIQWNDYRTSLLGFPVLAFQKTQVDGKDRYIFIGLYRMLLDKGSTKVLGFKPDKKITHKLFPKSYNEDGTVKEYQKLRDVAECWEFSNNARGYCSYRDPWNRVELSFLPPEGGTIENGGYTAKGAPVVANSFEYRYHAKDDLIDVLYDFKAATSKDLEEVSKDLGVTVAPGDYDAGAKALVSTHTNWEKVCKWLWSTNLDAVESQGTYVKVPVGDVAYEVGKYYIINEGGYAISNDEFNKNQTYYSKKTVEGVDEYNIVNVCPENYLYEVGKFYIKVAGNNTAITSDDVYTISKEAFLGGTDYYDFVEGDLSTFNERFDLLVDPATIEGDFDSSVQYYTWHGTEAKFNEDKTVTGVVTNPGHATGAVRPVINPTEEDWRAGKYYVAAPKTYEGKTFTHDTREYRAAKFVNEFEDHFDPEYVATYFVMTEVMELYDSRGKNCMMASWGPLKEGGNYIWYPIFYDIDTQLGINNTGIPSFEFNVDATQAGNYSTSDSILWNNFFKFFKDAWIVPKYRNLKGDDTSKFKKLINADNSSKAPLQSVDYIEKWYNFDPVVTNNIACKGERPLLAKNLDMYFKYITICNSKAKDEGVAHLAGQGSGGAFAEPDSGTYFYALQGDRSQSRQRFVGNRIEYIDSWLTQGNYARGGANRLWGRISANNRSDLDGSYADVHSDKWTNSTDDPYWVNNIPFGTKTHEFDSEYWIEPKPIRSAYVTAGDDSMNYPSQKYDGVNQIQFTLNELENGIKNSNNYPEQLLYIYGTNQMADFGDLSKMYWTEFKLEGNADKLTRLKLGHDGQTFDYKDSKATEKTNISWYNKKLNGITLPKLPLLKEANFCNIGLVNETSLDFSSSEKLENFRATGSSNITSINFADGVSLNTLYLPSSVGTLSLTQANLLTDLIGHDDAHPYEIPQLDLATDKLVAKRGLYLEGFFNGNSSLANIKFNGGSLGYNSYKILKRLYDVHNTAKTNANVTMLDVQWCPYTLLTEGDEFIPSKRYYIDNGHYGFTVYNNEDYSYNEAQFNIDILSGKLYREDNYGGREYEKVTLSADDYKPNTYYIKTEENDYELSYASYDSSKEYYSQKGLGADVISLNNDTITMLKQLYTNSNFKDSSGLNKPSLSGIIYIHNNTAIEESEINSILQQYYPNVTFFFNKVTKAYSAKFVLIDKDTGAEKYVDYRNDNMSGPSVQKIKATEMTLDNDKYFTNPYDLYKVERTHWDFYGWSTSSNKDDSDSIIYGVINDTMTEAEKIEAHNTAWKASKNRVITALDQYDYTFYAILTEHVYTATFLDTFDSSYKKTTTTAYNDRGSYMSDKVAPPVNLSQNELYMRNAFRGWTLDEDKAKIIYGDNLDIDELPLVNVSDYPATQDYTFYAVYQKESVFNSVVPEEYFIEILPTEYEAFFDYDDSPYNINYRNGCYIAIADAYKEYFKGKITLPTKYKGKSIYGYKGFNGNTEITHIFFDKNNQSELREIAYQTFAQMTSLKFVDFSGLTKLRLIGEEAFSGCSNFEGFTFHNPLRVIDKKAFASAGQKDKHTVTIYFNSELEEIGQQAFQFGARYEKVVFGSGENGQVTGASQLKQNTWEGTTAIIQNSTGYLVNTIEVYCKVEDVGKWRDWLYSTSFIKTVATPNIFINFAKQTA